MNAILAGITVLDFSEYIAGPYCGFLLADLGARVIKVEPPDGAEERRLSSLKRYGGNSRMSLAFNRGKESISIDLKTSDGRDIIHQLVKDADVVVQNFVPGAAAKLGIDYETLSALNPALIFLSSTAFGDVGPYKGRKGFDIIANAASGIMSNYADEDGEPRGPGGPPYIDISTGIYNALSVVSALYHRAKTGEGQKLESSLFSSGMALQMMNLINIESLDENLRTQEKAILKSISETGKSHTEIIDELAELRLREDQPDTIRPVEVPDCNHRPTDRHVYPYYRVYQTSSGYLSIAALNVKQRESLCTVLGFTDEHAQANYGSVSDQAYFAQKAMMEKIEASFKRQGNDYWIEKLEAAGVPCGQVNYRQDLLNDPQAQALDMVWNLTNTDLGDYQATGHPVRFSKTPVQPGKGAPGLGEDTRAVLQGAGFTDAQLDKLEALGIITCRNSLKNSAS